MTRSQAYHRLLVTAAEMGRSHRLAGIDPYANNTVAYLTDRIALAAGLSLRQADIDRWARDVAQEYRQGRRAAEVEVAR